MCLGPPPAFSFAKSGRLPWCPAPGSGHGWYLQEPSELAVAIVDVLVVVLVAQRVDAVAQGQQGAVDVCPLLHALPAVLGLGTGRGWLSPPLPWGSWVPTPSCSLAQGSERPR